jgi:hypothetical protein
MAKAKKKKKKKMVAQEWQEEVSLIMGINNFVKTINNFHIMLLQQCH